MATPRKKKPRKPRPGKGAALLDRARTELQEGERAAALRTTVQALRSVEGHNLAVAWHQVAVLIDDHPLPTHDELAWRAAVRAYQLDPEGELFEREAVRRTMWRSPYAQLWRSIGNVFLYAALVIREGGRRFAPAMLLMWPLSLLAVVPGVIFHGMGALGVRTVGALFAGRVARGVRERPEDPSLADELRSALQEADGTKA